MGEAIASNIKGETDAQERDWKIKKKELFIIYTLALMSLMVALDASVIFTSLPVSSSTRVLQAVCSATRTGDFETLDKHLTESGPFPGRTS